MQQPPIAQLYNGSSAVARARRRQRSPRHSSLKTTSIWPCTFPSATTRASPPQECRSIARFRERLHLSYLLLKALNAGRPKETPAIREQIPARQMKDAFGLRRRSPRNDQHRRNLLCLDDGRHLRERSNCGDRSDFPAGGMPVSSVTWRRKKARHLRRAPSQGG